MDFNLCSLTGIDGSTDFGRLRELAVDYPFVEFAVLHSLGRAGKENRYPSWNVINDVRHLRRSGVNTAIHFCGSAVGEFVAGNAAALAYAAQFGRVQLNFNAGRVDFTLEQLDRAIGRWDAPVITQHNRANAAWSAEITAPNHRVLFDESGGRGLAAGEWPAPLPGKACGYAGGISPANVAATLEALDGIVLPDGWIDMESSLRDENDLFDLDRCEVVLRTVAGRLTIGKLSTPHP